MNARQITNFLGITQRKEEPSPPEKVFEPEVFGPKEVYMEWENLSRPAKSPTGRKFTTTLIVMTVVIGLLLAIMQEFFLILAVASVVFIAYVLSKVPPEKMKYEISSHGILCGNIFMYWNQLSQFFFTYSDGQEILAVDTREALPGRIFLNFHKEDRDKLIKILNKYLVYIEEEPRTFIDKGFDAVKNRLSI